MTAQDSLRLEQEAEQAAQLTAPRGTKREEGTGISQYSTSRAQGQ